MRCFMWALIIFLGVFPLVSAALPPLYQTANEINAILTSEELGRYLQSGEMIMRIDKSTTGYVITTNHHRLAVDIVYGHVNHPGPARFTMKFHEKEALKDALN